MKTWILGVFALLSLMAGSAWAELPTEVTTALADAKTDGVTVAGLALVIVVAIAAFKYARRAL